MKRLNYASLFQRLTVRQRLRQVTAMMNDTLPAKLPVRVRYERIAKVEDDGFAGETLFRSDHIVIRINKPATKTGALDTLLHEWAHALDDRDDDEMDHPHDLRFYTLLHRVETAYDDGLAEVSLHYPEDV